VCALLEVRHLEVMMTLRLSEPRSGRVWLERNPDSELSMKLLHDLTYFYDLCSQDIFFPPCFLISELVLVEQESTIPVLRYVLFRVHLCHALILVNY
jgi:hypothetical protein